MDKLDQWKEETDRRFDNLDPLLSREPEPPLRFGEGDEGDYDDFRRKKSGDVGYRARNHTLGFRDVGFDDRDLRRERSGGGSGWGLPVTRHARGHQSARPTSCWDPTHRYQSSSPGFDKNQVSMKPPRFDGADTTNWISRVQYYFDHLMMPEAQRLHYAVMLFDPPASDWVFNYLPNNDFVTWQDFLEDVRDRFDRQGPKPFRRESLQLDRPLSSAATMALALELSDTTSERTPQPSGVAVQSQGGLGRAAVQLRPPMVRVSQAEKAERARLGLCYYCPDIWVMGHVCKQRWLCYAEEDDDVPTNAAHNGGANLDVDVPIDEPLEEIVKTANTPRQVLVGLYDEKIGEGFMSVDDMETNNGELENECSPFESDGVTNRLECLWENQELIEPLQMELKKVKATGLTTIVEEYETPTVIGDWKPWKMDESEEMQRRDCIAELHKSYREMMRKFDILNYQKMYAVGFVQQNEFQQFQVLLQRFKEDEAVQGGRVQTYVKARCVFDPGGDASPKLLLSTCRRFVVPTLRTRWILTGGELIRASFA